MIRLLLALTCTLCFVACGGAEPADNSGGKAIGGDTMIDDGHGERKPLGKLTVAGHTFEVVQSGDVMPGKEGAFDFEFGADKDLPKVMRAWVGIESGKGSMKARLGKEGDHGMHGHVEVPKPIPAGSMLWVEIEDGDQKGAASIAYK